MDYQERVIFIKKGVPPLLTMKVTKLLAASATSLALLGTTTHGKDETPIIPTGHLNASSGLVRAESSVDLEWKVSIPARTVEELIDITEDDEIIAKEDVAFEVKMLGAEYAWKGDYALAYGWYTYADSPWYNFFWGYGDDANALSKKSCDILRAGEELSFGFRGSKNGFRDMPWQHRTWHDDRWSGTGPSWYSNDNPAIVLKDGDKLPDYAAATSQTDIATFLAPYLTDDKKNSKAKRVNIGPKDLIILADLNREKKDKTADYQDFVILVTFTEAANSTCTRRWNGPQPPKPLTTPTTPFVPQPVPPMPDYGEDRNPE